MMLLTSSFVWLEVVVRLKPAHWPTLKGRSYIRQDNGWLAYHCTNMGMTTWT